MKAEIHFFMSKQDAQEFMTHVEEVVDSIREHDESSFLMIGDCQIVYTPTVMSDDTLCAGSIAINSGGIDQGCEQRLKADGIFKKLRKWIKKNYTNRLCTWTEENVDKVSRVREFWIGPDARQKKEEDSKILLRLSPASSTRFDLAPDMSVMGDIMPKGKTKR